MKKWTARLFSCLLITAMITTGLYFPTHAEDEQEVQIILGFEEIEDSSIALSEKCSLEDLYEKMPDSIRVYLEGKSDPAVIPVTWEADEDYENTNRSGYVFWAKWDENLYQVDKGYDVEDYFPFIEVIFNHGDDGISSADLSDGIENIVKRAYQQVRIRWTPLENVDGYMNSEGELFGTFEAGTEYRGIPYGQLIDAGKYVPASASFDTFLNAVKDSESVFYTERGRYDGHSNESPYYGNDCSAFVSYTYGMPRRTTTWFADSDLFTEVEDNSIQNAQIGDCFNKKGSHIELITDIIRNDDGIVETVEVSEQTPPIARTVTYTAEEVQEIIDGGYTLLRYNDRETVEEPEDYDGYESDQADSNEPDSNEPENPFVDVSEDKYYYDAVLWAYENGITEGEDETHFAPENTCTRGQTVTFLWRAEGKPEAENTDHPFVDLNEERYYYDAVLWAYENGITYGADETHFCPNETVTRGQFVSFLYRTMGEPEYTIENPFSDVSETKYYYNAVLWAYENGITEGEDETHFGPENTCTRGQVVTFLHRAYNE